MNSIAHLIATAVLGQATGESAADPQGAASAQIQSVWDFILKGGPMMIPIALCSFIALTVIVERLVSLRRRNVVPPDFLSGLKAAMKIGEEDRSKAISHCQANDSPLASILAAGVRRLSEPVELLEKHIQEAGERAVVGLRKNLRALSVIGSICPLLGLLGTIFGMIKAFQTVATSGEALGKTELLAEGIYQAMITTAAGLLVAIPVIIAYHLIAGKIDRLMNEMDEMTIEFVEEYVYSDEMRSDSSLRIRHANGSDSAEKTAAVQS